MPDRKRVIALGFFDGVHIGHAALLEMTKRRAAEKHAVPAVLTFDTHPDTLVKGVEVPLINSAEERAEIIRHVFGIDSVISIHFNENMMRMPWQNFADSVREELHACHLVMGYDFSCGWKGEGRPARLAAYCTKHGMGCDIISAVCRDGEVVSSTRIRSLLEAGRVEEANDLLGHPHFLVDKVHYGFRLGHKLGAPTINMRFAPGVLAVTNIGVRPTVSGGDQVSVESYILDYEGDLYERRVRVEFHHFIRDEEKFPNTAALREQIQRDADTTRAYFAENP